MVFDRCLTLQTNFSLIHVICQTAYIIFTIRFRKGVMKSVSTGLDTMVRAHSHIHHLHHLHDGLEHAEVRGERVGGEGPTAPGGRVRVVVDGPEGGIISQFDLSNTLISF